MLVIGIDCATDFENVGAASATTADTRPTLKSIRDVSPRVLASILRAAKASGDQVLLALDAPLGWPAPLASALTAHSAGEDLGEEANALFRRTTDIRLKVATGQQPLDVGADRIARTAHAALRLLAELRRLVNDPMPLAWGPRFSDPIACIEVYPAATLRAHQLPYRGYKGKTEEHSTKRAAIVQRLIRHLILSTDCFADLVASDHAIDAAACVIAGMDFLKGAADPPADEGLARKEGWIWVRSRRDA